MRPRTTFCISGGSKPNSSSSTSQTSTTAEFAIIDKFDFLSAVFYILTELDVDFELLFAVCEEFSVLLVRESSSKKFS